MNIPHVVVEQYRVGGRIITVLGPFASKEEANTEANRLNANEMQQRPMLYAYMVHPLVRELVAAPSTVAPASEEWS